jgi:hypothetical protein
MGNHWCIHLPDFLAENGTIAAYSPRGLRLAKYWTELVAQASNYDESTTVQCRRRPMWMSLVSVILTFCPKSDLSIQSGRFAAKSQQFPKIIASDLGHD